MKTHFVIKVLEVVHLDLRHFCYCKKQDNNVSACWILLLVQDVESKAYLYYIMLLTYICQIFAVGWWALRMCRN